MKPLIYRCAWNLPRDHRVEFALYSHGIGEQMSPGILHNASATDDWLLIYFHDEATAGGKRGVANVPAGTMVIWPPGATRIYGHAKEAWAHSWLQATGTRIVPILDRLGLQPEEAFPAGGPDAVAHGIFELHNEMTGFQNPSARILGNLFENWLLSLIRGLQDKETAREQRLRMLKRHLDIHLDAPMTLRDMARQAGMSASHLSALFRATYGESPVAYHIIRRIDTARYLLANRDLPVAEVAEQIGYPDLPSFSRMFKRVAGRSPRSYRQEAGRMRHAPG
jgi:AraC-like DNA-binding protein